MEYNKMNEVLPNILIDGIPFILKEHLLQQWATEKMIYKHQMKDEGSFYWFMFDRKTKGLITGMQQFDSYNKDMVRIILPADVLRQTDYCTTDNQRETKSYGNNKVCNYQVLPEPVAQHLIRELRVMDVVPTDPYLREIVEQLISFMPEELKQQINWEKPISRKIKGTRKRWL